MNATLGESAQAHIKALYERDQVNVTRGTKCSEGLKWVERSRSFALFSLFL